MERGGEDGNRNQSKLVTECSKYHLAARLINLIIALIF